MNDGNTATEALAGSDQLQSLIETIQEQQRRIDALEGRSVIDAPFAGDIPAYKLNGPCYLEDDTYHAEGETIEYTGECNLNMVPLNESARKRMQAYVDGLSEGQRRYYEMQGRVAPAMLITDNGAIIAQRMADERRQPGLVPFVIPEEKGEVAQMPHMPEAQAKKRGRPPKANPVVSAKAPAKVSQHLMPTPILGRTG